MKEINNIKEVYFIGIGGIGMSALARYFKAKGKKVSGYDKTETVLSKQLVQEGIPVYYEDDEKYIAKGADIIVYTPAVPKEHKGLLYYRQNGYPVLKRSDVLGEITKSSFNICIAGTHGKTTITTMTAHLLRHSGYGCNAFLGGIAANYNSNFWSSERNVCVVEADEYDRSFLKLQPDIAAISAMDADHLDIYGTEDKMQQAFVDFAGKVKKGGTLLSKYGLAKENDLKADHHLTYSLQNNNANAYAANIANREGGYTFDAYINDRWLKDIELNMGGLHNIENAVAAIAIAKQLHIEDEKIKAAVAAFKGVKRRFEYIIPPAGKKATVYIDDYAHHPAELEALIKGVKLLFADKKCTVVFQPHLFSRTRDLAEAFAASLDMADEVILLPVYPARELPVEGVTSRLILDKMKNEYKHLMNKEETLNWIRKHYDKNKPGVLITSGAGDIDQMVQAVKGILEGGKW
ncbi:UDP-N-acetylmuramate--L-alanine ligase [Agriterribacter sp.]|uniref:UDP-N-acetylmuramate--L-alanine ligase n=1 Tax=Agriterribacter sp. TaxID=2821509 RepID=UPI002CCC8FDC|nr:UDP-N-acetylmuramate--L-alanine ligase [Agriterribacter sp.]HRP55215.1 UDP-N-acetylmuramate--L-alanine ligase [Agriterribacter sp.]